MSALEAALDYTLGAVFGRAVSVFPVVPRGKRPITTRGFDDATTDLERVGEWWTDCPDANIGLPLAANGLCAVDLDGPEGLHTWSDLGTEYPGPVTCCTETGSGGAHLIYRIPTGRNPRGTPRVFGNVDLRGPGYLVAPPSVHANGTVYRWVTPPWRLAPQPAPGWILEPLEVKRPVGPVYEPRDGSHTPYGRAALIGIVDELADAPEGTRNHALYSRTRRVLDLIASGDLEEANALEVLRIAAERSGLPAHEIERTVASAMTGGGRV